MIWMIIGYAKTYLDKCSRDHIGAYAAQAAYFMIMSAIPFLMLLAALLRIIPASKEYFDVLIIDVLPVQFEPYAEKAMDLIMTASIGAISISALMAIWASGKAFQNLMVGLNVVHKVTETRNWFVNRFWAMVYTSLILIAIVVIMFMIVFTQRLQSLFTNSYGFLAYVVGIRPLLRGLFVFLILIVLFTFIFASLPNIKLTFVSQLPGGIICAIIWYFFSAFLAVWVNFFNGFSMYGALATIMVIMFWLYFCMYFMLMCAEVNQFFGEAFGRGFEKWKLSFKEQHPLIGNFLNRLKKENRNKEVGDKS